MVGGLCRLLSTAPQHSEGVPLPSPLWGVLLGTLQGPSPQDFCPVFSLVEASTLTGSNPDFTSCFHISNPPWFSLATRQKMASVLA